MSIPTPDAPYIASHTITKPRARWPLVVAIMVIVLFVFLALLHHFFFGYDTVMQARSPDGRYTAGILQNGFWHDFSIGMETTGLHPFGLGREIVSGYADEYFDPASLRWQDNHTLIVNYNSSVRSRPDVQWRDVKVVFDRIHAGKAVMRR